MTVETMLRMLSAAAVAATVSVRMIRFVRIGTLLWRPRDGSVSGRRH